MSSLSRAIDALADAVPDGHLIVALDGTDLLDEATRLLTERQARIEALEAEAAETSRILDGALATIKSTPTADSLMERMQEVQDAWKAKYAALKALVPDPDDLRVLCDLAEYTVREVDFTGNSSAPSLRERIRVAATNVRATLPPTKVVANEGVPPDAVVMRSGDRTTVVRGLAPKGEDDGK